MAAITMDQAPRELARRRRQQLPAGVALPTPTPAPTQPGTITRPGTQDAVRFGQPTSSVPQFPKFKMPGTGGQVGNYGSPDATGGAATMAIVPGQGGYWTDGSKKTWVPGSPNDQRVGHYGMPDQPWEMGTPDPRPGSIWGDPFGHFGVQMPGVQQPGQRRDLYQDWLKYQAGGPANVREAFSMDNDLAALDPGDFGGDHGALRRWQAQELAARGYVRPEDIDRTVARLEQTAGNWYYPTEQKLMDFDKFDVSYNKDNPAQRAEVQRASDFGHSLPDSTALSRAGWQNVTPQQLAQFAQQGFIPAGPLAGGVSSGYSTGSGTTTPSGGWTTTPGPAGSLTNYGGQDGIAMPGQIFDDPTSKLLEDLIKGQIGQLTQPTNDPLRGQFQDVLQQQLNKLQGTTAPSSEEQFRRLLQQQIEEFSTQPGYSAAEQAVMNTQLSEPIEALRRTSQQRERERTAAAGYLPTSGLHNARQSASDRYYDQLRMQAYRDQAIDSINRRDRDIAEGLGLSRSLVDYDKMAQDRDLSRAGQSANVAGLLAALAQGTRAEEQGRQNQSIQLATLLRQMPMDAQRQAMAVIQGTAPPESLLPMLTTLLNQSNQQGQNFYAMLGQLASLFD